MKDRKISYQNPPFHFFSSTTICQFKILMYMMFVAGDDIETQRNGIVVLVWPGLQTPKPPNSRFLRFSGKVMKTIPTRFACFHMCFPSTKLFRLMRIFILTTLSIATIATRVKVHTGMFWQDHKFTQNAVSNCSSFSSSSFRDVMYSIM